MDEPQVEAALREIVTKNSRLRVQSIADDDTLAGDLGFDSLAFLMTLSDLEDRFHITFPVEKIDELRYLSFRDLVCMMQEKIPRYSQKC